MASITSIAIRRQLAREAIDNSLSIIAAKLGVGVDKQPTRHARQPELALAMELERVAETLAQIVKVMDEKKRKAK